MKQFVCLLVLSIFSFVSNAQDPSDVHKGTMYLSTGIGFATAWDGYGTTKVPPISASLDIGVADNITVGPYLAYSSSGADEVYFSETYSYKYSHLLIGGKGAYHFGLSPKWSAYVGAILGYRSTKSILDYKDGYGSTTVFNEKSGGLLYDFFVGGKLRLSNHASAFAELGYGITYLNLGVSFKLK